MYFYKLFQRFKGWCVCTKWIYYSTSRPKWPFSLTDYYTTDTGLVITTVFSDNFLYLFMYAVYMVCARHYAY